MLEALITLLPNSPLASEEKLDRVACKEENSLLILGSGSLGFYHGTPWCQAIKCIKKLTGHIIYFYACHIPCTEGSLENKHHLKLIHFSEAREFKQQKDDCFLQHC